MSDKNLVLRINIKLCVKYGKGASETSALLILACSGCVVMKLCIFEWHRHFKKMAKECARWPENMLGGKDLNSCLPPEIFTITMLLRMMR
jgi:hypothetical protein